MFSPPLEVALGESYAYGDYDIEGHSELEQSRFSEPGHQYSAAAMVIVSWQIMCQAPKSETAVRD